MSRTERAFKQLGESVKSDVQDTLFHTQESIRKTVNNVENNSKGYLAETLLSLRRLIIHESVRRDCTLSQARRVDQTTDFILEQADKLDPFKVRMQIANYDGWKQEKQNLKK